MHRASFSKLHFCVSSDILAPSHINKITPQKSIPAGLLESVKGNPDLETEFRNLLFIGKTEDKRMAGVSKAFKTVGV